MIKNFRSFKIKSLTEEIINTCGSILGGAGFIAFFINQFCWIYLDTSNGYDKTPRVRYSFEGFGPYDKDVKKEDENIKKCSIRLAGIGTITIASAFVLTAIAEAIKFFQNNF